MFPQSYSTINRQRADKGPQQSLSLDSLGGHCISLSRMLDSFTNLIPGDVCAGKSCQVFVLVEGMGHLPVGASYFQYRGHH